MTTADGALTVTTRCNGTTKLGRTLWGGTRGFLSNAIQGVSQGFRKSLELHLSRAKRAPPLAAPSLAPCASSRRAWRLWTPRPSRGRPAQRGAPPPPWVLGPAASQAADATCVRPSRHGIGYKAAMEQREYQGTVRECLVMRPSLLKERVPSSVGTTAASVLPWPPGVLSWPPGALGSRHVPPGCAAHSGSGADRWTAEGTTLSRAGPSRRRAVRPRGPAAVANCRGVVALRRCGFSHDVVVPVPPEIKVTCPSATTITIFGTSKQQVGPSTAFYCPCACNATIPAARQLCVQLYPRPHLCMHTHMHVHMPMPMHMHMHYAHACRWGSSPAGYASSVSLSRTRARPHAQSGLDWPAAASLQRPVRPSAATCRHVPPLPPRQPREADGWRRDCTA